MLQYSLNVSMFYFNEMAKRWGNFAKIVANVIFLFQYDFKFKSEHILSKISFDSINNEGYIYISISFGELEKSNERAASFLIHCWFSYNKIDI